MRSLFGSVFTSKKKRQHEQEEARRQEQDARRQEDDVRRREDEARHQEEIAEYARRRRELQDERRQGEAKLARLQQEGEEVHRQREENHRKHTLPVVQNNLAMASILLHRSGRPSDSDVIRAFGLGLFGSSGMNQDLAGFKVYESEVMAAAKSKASSEAIAARWKVHGVGASDEQEEDEDARPAHRAARLLHRSIAMLLDLMPEQAEGLRQILELRGLNTRILTSERDYLVALQERQGEGGQ